VSEFGLNAPEDAIYWGVLEAIVYVHSIIQLHLFLRCILGWIVCNR